MLTTADSSTQEELRKALHGAPPATLENLAAALIGDLLGVTVVVAKSGFQHGGDAGTAGRQGRHLRLESKRYAQDTALDDRELLGELQQAVARDRFLEAWILVSTRDVPEQLEEQLVNAGKSLGLAVVTIDWKATGLSALAALCASSPLLVSTLISPAAGKLADTLKPVASAAIERINRELQTWCLGFEALRRKSHDVVREIWTLPRESSAAIGQDAAGGARKELVHRRAVHDTLDAWWRDAAPNDSVAAVVGLEGRGKTWVALHWVVDKLATLPIVLVVPASAATGLATGSATEVQDFLADRIHNVAGVVDREYSRRRFSRLLTRPEAEGPVLVLLFDGLNQESGVSWSQLFKVLLAKPFAGRVRVLATTRNYHFEQRLKQLAELVVRPTVISVLDYDLNPGGEFDQRLALEGLTRHDLNPELIELACVPRLFQLVVMLRATLAGLGQVTVHRLLWEYGRNSLGSLSGRSFTEKEWRRWLQDVATQYLSGGKTFSMTNLAGTVDRADLPRTDVFNRLSDIVDARFVTDDPFGNYQFDPLLVTHALATALLATLERKKLDDVDKIADQLAKWLDPIAGLDQQTEVLRASASLALESAQTRPALISALITAWIQSQNIPEAHYLELCRLAPSVVDALLDGLERCESRHHAYARQWVLDAIHSVDRADSAALGKIHARIGRWVAIVSRDLRPGNAGDQSWQATVARRLVTRVGVDAVGKHTVLGISLEFVGLDDRELVELIPRLLAGRRLQNGVSWFATSALVAVVSFRARGWEGIEWLCLLNEADFMETAEALRKLSTEIAARQPEPGVHTNLAAQVAAHLLWLAATDEDDAKAAVANRSIEGAWTYERDYLTRPSKSHFALERRHANETLNDSELSVVRRVARTRDFWIDPSFGVPETFNNEIRAAAETFDYSSIGFGTQTEGSIDFEELEPAIARIAPDVLANIARQITWSLENLPAELRYQRSFRTMDYFVLAGKSESDAAATLRALGRESVARNELFAANQLLVLELSCLDALDQARRVIRSQLDSLFTLLGEVLKPLSAPEIDELVQSYAAGSRLELQALLILLSRHDGGVSESAWSWLLGVALGADGEFHGLAFRALEAIDRVRFGRILLARGWAWSPNLDQRVNHIGSGALIAAAGGLPLERMSSRIAPWRLLEAASAWGNDPNDVRLAAGILTAVLTDHRQEAPDTGSTLTVEHVMGQSGPMPVSIEPNDADPSEVDNGKANGPVVVADSDRDAERYERAARVAQERIANALKSGASLLVVQIESGDFEPAIQHAPDHVDRWLEGLDGVTPDFARRLRVAQPAFLALCEALLRVDDARGPQLWNALRQLSSMRVLGEAGIEELVHILFRVRETERVRALRMQLLELDDCNTDLALFSIALAAEINGQRVWLEEIIQEDDASAIQWRRMRATVLRGFRSGNSLPVGDAWPDDKIRTRREHLKVSSAQWQFREACAKHWWNTYWHAPDDTSAYAAWVMLLRSVDRRAWCWILNEFPTEAEGLPLYRVKAAHLRLNIHSLRRAMEKREEKLKKQFLTRDIVNGAGPWGSHN